MSAAEKELQFRRQTDLFIYSQMKKFDGVQSREQLYDATKSVLGGLGTYVNADRIYFYQKFGQEHVQHVAYGWRDWTKVNLYMNEEACAREVMRTFHDALGQGEVVIIDDVNQEKDVHPQLFSTLMAGGVKSFSVAPVLEDGRLDGVLAVVNADMQHHDVLSFLLNGSVMLFAIHYEAMRHMDSVARLTSTDILTHLDNRISGGQKVNESLARGEHGAFLLIDCDNFKQVNERFGQQVGDRVLIEVTKVIRSVFPQGTSMRLAGDEFGIYFPLLDQDRVLAGQWIYRFFWNVNRMKVEGMTGYRVSFSLGVFSFDKGSYTSFDSVYQHARDLCKKAKTFEGNYAMFDDGGIPDLETAFYLLREDRRLYDRVNDEMFHITNEEDWLHYLDNCAMMKSNMCWRNQRQYEQILNYFGSGNVIEDDYAQLYDLVLRFRNTLDSFMVETLVGNILLPHYEQLMASGSDLLPKHTLHGMLAKLYLHLGDSLTGVMLMGDHSQARRVRQLFDKCLEVSAILKRDDPAYEYQIYALMSLVGHFELFDKQQITPQEYDAYYERLRLFLVGEEAVTLHDPILLPYYTYLLHSAGHYPMLRALHLMLKSERTPDEEYELVMKMLYVRQHQKNGVLDTCYPSELYHRIDHLLQLHLFREKSADELFEADYKELDSYRNSLTAVLSTSDLMRFVILLLAAMTSLKRSSLSPERQRAYTLECWDLFLQLYKRKKNEATDRQTCFVACFILGRFISNHLLTAEDKRQYLVRTLGVLMTDTYSHSMAMAAYANVITSHIIDRHPKLMVGVLPGINSTEQVQQHKQELLDFMHMACMIHDIGKLYVIPIITNSYRRLTDHEFQMLRMHPLFGCEILKGDSYFDQFADIVGGHHLSYDGKGGYPQGFIMHHPDQRILLDIVAICDSLEAATSRIGRNYRASKSFSQIMDEFYSDAGVRYNPDVLRSIIASTETYNMLKQMVDLNWKTIYLHIFQDIVLDQISPSTSDEVLGQLMHPVASEHKHMQSAAGTQTISMDQLKRIADEQDSYNKWLTQRLVESVEAKYEFDQVAKGLHAVFEVMALVKVKDGSIKILQGHPEFLRVFPPTMYHPVKAMTEYSVNNVVKPEWVPQLLAFNDHTTLAERLKGRKSINIELETNFEGWCRFSYCPAEYDDQGNLNQALFMAENINEEVMQMRSLKLLAEYDGLTGLLSRYGGEKQMRDLLEKRTPGVFTVIDIDAFKSVNDTFGHAVGDKVLATIAHQIDGYQQSLVIRQGGDEFVAFIPSDDLRQEVHEQHTMELFDKLEAIEMPELKGRKVTISIGAVFYDGLVPTTFDALFHQADQLLYESKRFEGNHVTFDRFNPITTNN